MNPVPSLLIYLSLSIYITVLPLMSARGAHFFKGLREGALIRGRRSFEGGAHSFDDQMVKFITKYIRIFTLVSFENYNFQDIRPTKIFELAWIPFFHYRGLQNRRQRTDFRLKNRWSHFENRRLPAPILTNKNRGQDDNCFNKKKPLE